MAKQLVASRYILKLHSEVVRRAKWNMTISLEDARRNGDLIALNDSLTLRWIDELNGCPNTEDEVKRIRREIRAIKREPSSTKNRHEVKRLYAELDAVQYKPDMMNLVIDRSSDLIRAAKGFTINGVKYVRLLGTNGGVKMSTIIFISERLAPEIRKRIDNGRNMKKPIVPAKLEAYRALTCSGSTPVSWPSSVLVVPDCVTHFKEDVVMLGDGDDNGPSISEIKDFDMELKESDGYGLMLPSLAERWSKDLHLSYTVSGCCIRNSFAKGMVYAFDFVDFAEKVAHNYIVKDSWGQEHDIRDVELILPESIVKLWDSYDSIDHYLACCHENHYTFSVTKACDRELEHEHTLNYQFIQSYDLTDDQIDELISPTMSELRDVISGDWRRALAYLCGSNVTDENVWRMEFLPYIRAIMADRRMFNDPYTRRMIYKMIENRINRAKIGVLGVHGNFSMLCGDPYALCQSVFGLPVTGLLKAGELYNKYWVDSGAEYVATFRAPMSAHADIRKMRIARTDEMLYWYRYMTTCTMTNAWDSATAAWNGAD